MQETTESTMPSLVQHYIGLWNDYAAAGREFNARLAELELRDKRARGIDCGFGGIFGYRSVVSLDDVASSVRRGIIRVASEHFATGGAVLKIDESEFAVKGDGMFSPEQLWAALSDRFGEGKGSLLAYEQARQTLQNAFRELGQSGSGVKVVGGRMVLTAFVSWDDQFPPANYHYDTWRKMQRVLSALDCVIQWSGEQPSDQAELHRAAIINAIRDARNAAPPRYEADLYTVVFFQRKIEFRLRPALADQLRLFVHEFGPKHPAPIAQ